MRVSSWKAFLKTNYFWIILSLGIVFFSSWLMFHTFSYNGKESDMLIATKAWSDFGAHIPLIRSFSFGKNWPPEYPLFPGEPIRYHFLFYFLVGMIEKIGVRIDYALNIPSIIGFAGLLIGLAIVAQKLFHDRRITLLTVIFSIFNGSFSYIRFFQKFPLSIRSFLDIVTNESFPSFAPWGDGEITAFWNLNIFTNQRHLAFGFGLALLFIAMLLVMEKKPLKTQIFLCVPEIIILALLPYFHQPMLVILALFMGFYFFLFKRLRIPLLVIGLYGIMYMLPQMIPIVSKQSSSFQWNPGFLLSPPLTIPHVIWYWIQNIGLHFFLIPIGWIFAPKYIKKVTIPLIGVFLIPNLFQFSVEMAANHKFFNFYLLVGYMLSAYTLIKAFDQIRKKTVFIAYSFISIVFISLTLSGIIDFFPIYNDGFMHLTDIPKNSVATWIKDNTPPDSVFLNSSYFFHPASLAGRKIFHGWPYFTWSAGYDTNQRTKIMETLYETRNITEFCELLEINHISYMTVQDTHGDINLPHIDPMYYFQRFQPVLIEDKVNPLYIYSTETMCAHRL